MVKKLFSEQERKNISQAVADVEKHTRGEIVPMIVESSGAYAWVHLLGALLGLALVSIFIIFWNLKGDWPFEWEEIFFAQGCGIALGVGLSAIPAIKRFLIPKSTLDEEVHEAALASFMAQGIHETRDHTGILIYISLFEHQVEILADKGIHQVIGKNDFWQAQSDTIVVEIRRGQASAGLIQAIQIIGKILAEHFPPQGDNPNELHNELRG